jgi:hypothetical protein
MERLVEFNVAAVIDALVRTCDGPTANELRITRYASRAAALVDAVARFERANPDAFLDMPGGALLQRCSGEMRATLVEVDRFMQRAAVARPAALDRAARATANRASHWHPSPISIPQEGELA